MRIASVSVTGVATSAWLPLDPYTSAGSADGLFFKVGAGATAALEVTADDVFNPFVVPVAFPLAAPFAAMTTNVAGLLPFSAKAIRINQSVGASASSLQVVVRGGI